MIILRYSDFWILFWDIQKSNQLVGDEDKKEFGLFNNKDREDNFSKVSNFGKVIFYNYFFTHFPFLNTWSRL